jgi:hypothetical protein
MAVTLNLLPGDCVRTEVGFRGRVVDLNRLTAFVDVEIQLEGGAELLPFLLSELTKIQPPKQPSRLRLTTP